MQTVELEHELTDKEHRAFLRKLRGDLKLAASNLNGGQARYLVDLFYQLQEFRKASKNIVRGTDEPNFLVDWLGTEFNALESTISTVMGHYASQHTVGAWAQSIVGVGPIISAGLVCHIDITKAKTAGSIWRFAGLDPSVSWTGSALATKQVNELLNKRKLTEAVAREIVTKLGKNPDTILNFATSKPNGEPKKLTKDSLAKAIARRPWNTKLKTLGWKLTECLVKNSNNKKSFYGPLYQNYKAKLIEQNEAGAFEEAAKVGAARVKKTTEAYKFYIEGKLPPGHIQARATRWLRKLFLSHYHAVAYRAHYGEDAPKPYVIAHLDHVHMIEVPNWPF